jgi:transcriptional regulator with XRE-family HTH domain
MSENRSRVSMKVNAELIVRLRKERSWSQDELAIASGVNLRTIQRVEKDATASLQTKKALAAALDLDARDLDSEGVPMKLCPVCGSNELYEYDEYFSDPSAPGGATLLPGLGGILSAARIRPSVCHGCGHVQIFASEEARKKLKTAKHWKAVSA